VTQNKCEDHREILLQEITRQESEYSNLKDKLSQTKLRLEELKSELATMEFHTEPVSSSTQRQPAEVMTATQKVALFLSLFRGRKDVFPTLWVNSRTGKKGYSPACANEWVRGVCEKPKIKCGECPNQAFLSVTNQAILDHLQARQVMGLYPLLEDETCWLLAVDFDKESWAVDVSAFIDTCRSINIPVSIERSRSGDGAHAWFFFTSPLPAAAARRFGCYLITETMSRHHRLPMNSYDRLFPNQDTLPRGGFGNLIALPLQHKPRKEGNTVFLDDNLSPYPDQWVYLASIKKIKPATIIRITEEAARRNQIIGVKFSTSGEELADSVPWEKPMSNRPKTVRITEPIPATIHAVLAQQLFINKTSLPSSLLNQIKRLAAFQNPEFYKRQNMRLSTALTPRVITCAEEFVEHIAIPRGCQEELISLLRKYSSELSIDDKRFNGEPINVNFTGDLTPIQRKAVDELLKHDIGVFVAPPGMGKTVVGVYLAAKRNCNALILVHRQPLLDQWVAQLSLFLGLEAKDIGQIGGGNHKPNGKLDVAMLQSLVRKNQVEDLVANYGHIIVDECHHLPAVSFERVLKEAKARFITGLTATPQRRDGQHPIIKMQLGSVRYSVNTKNQAESRPFDHYIAIRDTDFILEENSEDLKIQSLYRLLAEDDKRNEMIFDDVLHALEEGRSPILLTERKEHLNYLAEYFRKFTRNLIVLHGGKSSKKRQQDLEQLGAIPDNEERLILATGRYIGEGFDDARLDTLFLALPVSWKGTLIQYVGRLHRLHPDKTEVRVYDYVDRNVPMLERMFQRRMRGYRAIGYAAKESSAL
jgi:superfamily II DNA or RNA helicase